MKRLRPWIGIVATSQGTVLIDSGNGTVHGAAIQAALEQINAPPVSHILLTHHHWDHVFGNCAFPDAYIVAHEQTQQHLEVMAQEPWSEGYVETKGGRRAQMVMQLMKRAVSDWSTFRAVPAHETFDTFYHLTLGQYRFTVEHVGGQHEPDQCIVHVQPGNVLFLGDAAYGRGSQSQWNYPQLGAALRDFLARRADWYVEGHRTPARAESFARRIEHFMPVLWDA
jgi:glyoxylase-like metal-dependent hydrolase (beta-lactamase superfamily II)